MLQYKIKPKWYLLFQIEVLKSLRRRKETANYNAIKTAITSFE